MQVPIEFSSDTIRAQGFASYYQQLIINPMNTYSTTTTSELIRFQFNTKNYFDPSQVYLDVTIAIPDELTMKGCGLLLDGSANSLISQIQIYSNGSLKERIDEVDQIGDLIKELTIDPDNCMSKDYMGLAQYQPHGSSYHRQAGFFKSVGQFSGADAGQRWQQNYGAIGYQPTQILPHAPIVATPFQNTNTANQLISDYAFWGQDIALLGGANDSYFDITSYTSAGIGTAIMSSLIRHQALTNGSYPFYFPLNLYAAIKNAAKNTNAQGYNSAPTYNRCEFGQAFLGGDYGCQGPQSKNYHYKSDGEAALTTFTTFANQYVQSPNPCSVSGYQVYESDALMTNGKCIMLSHYPTCHIQNGLNVGTPIAQTKKRFLIPILSGLIGQLVPKQKLIPGQSFGNCQIDFRLNPYAFFLSGVSAIADRNISQTSSADTFQSYMLPRQWTVERASLVLDTYQYDSLFQQQLEDQLRSGIYSNSLSFSIGPRYSVASTSQLQNSWQITNSIKSLRMMIMQIISDDYLTYTYCRKNFRLSGNITSAQLKTGGEYIPTTPIRGHAGNCIINSTITDDNTEFVAWCAKQLGSFFNTDKMFAINKVNFAVNDRIYNPQWIAPATVTQPADQIIIANNLSLLYGQPGQNEQRYLGQALYPWSFGQKPYQSETLQGLDTTNLKPFELEIKVSTLNGTNARPQTMYFFLLHDLFVKYSIDGVEVEGQG